MKDSLRLLIQKQHKFDFALFILFILYLILGLKTPITIATIVDSIPGKIGILSIVILLFIYSHPIVAILSLYVAYDLIRRSSLASGNDAMERYTPNEQHKMSQFTAFNQFPYTLEQEIVQKMAPLSQNGGSLSTASYKPLLEQQHQAASINMTN